MTWLTGGALSVAVFMIVGLISLVVAMGTTTFWPVPLVHLELQDGDALMGELTRVEEIPDSGGALRRLMRSANFDLTDEHFEWADESDIVAETHPDWAILVERLDWGRFYGTPTRFEHPGGVVEGTPETVWAAFQAAHGEVRDRWHERRAIERGPIGDFNAEGEALRLELRTEGLDHGFRSAPYREAEQRFQAAEEARTRRYDTLRAGIDELDALNDEYTLELTTADGEQAGIQVAEIVRAFAPNQLSLLDKLGVYLSRWWEFLTDEPRFANQEGGVFPAIFGTVMMTLIMTVFVVPFGVLAALYLREYAKQGLLVSIVRVAVNNLAGVPSIVFGVFGLGFFCYFTGTWIDEMFFAAKLPSPTFRTGGILWASLTLALLTLPVVIVATEEALAAVPNSMREGSYACGASKWQTIRRIVLPRALPGIMTGLVLAIARGAGEVAPLMLVGALKLAPELPLDMHAPFVHLERSFMHLGYHIYDLGFHSQNSEAAKPMVFTTTLLLIGIVVALDIAAISIRSRLRRRYVTGRI